jgi:predicted NAD/FAD-binding protein
MVEVQDGTMTVFEAVVNGVAKGTAANMILNATSRETAVVLVHTAGLLAGAGYLIDRTMNSSGTPCRPSEEIAA